MTMKRFVLLLLIIVAVTPPFTSAQEAAEPAPETEAAVTGEPGETEEPVPVAAKKNRFASKLSVFEPMYGAIGWRGRTNAKFQLSFKYRFVNPEGRLAKTSNWFNSFYLGYTQTSLWDLESSSAPFYDTSYKPSLFFLHENTEWISNPKINMGLQTGVEHESNGQGGEESRSLNSVYVRPIFTFGGVLGARLIVAPKMSYLFSLSDNPDIADYRGYVDLVVALTDDDGWQVEATLRKGTASSYGSIQVDVSYPLDRVFTRSFDAFLQLQYFNGWGESLRSYNEKLPSQFRIGLMMVR